MKGKMITDDLIQMALLGYIIRRREVEAEIAELERRLKGKQGRIQIDGLHRATTVTGMKKQKKHHISPEGRARIAAAQKRRWANRKKGE